jgi:hypothetical protein
MNGDTQRTRERVRWSAGDWQAMKVVYFNPSMIAFKVALGRMAWPVFTLSGW